MASEQYIFYSGAGLPSTPIKDAFASVPEVLGSLSPAPLVGSNFPGQTLSSGAFSNQTSFFPKSGRWNTFNGQFGNYNNPVSITSNSLQTMHSNTNSSCLQNTIEATLLLSADLEAENYGNNTKGHLMPSFFPEANAQAEAMQLILLNSGYNGYDDESTPANMVLLSPPAGITVQGNQLYNAGQSQQNYIGITLPSSLSPGSLSPHSSLTSIADVTIPHPCPSSSFPTLGTKNSCNNWKNDELIFTSSGEAVLPIKLLPNTETNSVTSGHLSMQHVSEYGMQHAAVLSNTSDRQGRLQDAECNQYQIETTCIGASSYGQSLNLSLSSCRPLHNFDSQFEPIVHRTRMSNELEEKGIAGQTVNVVNSELSHSRTWTRDLVSETSFLDIPPQSNAPSVVVGSFSFLCCSKYLKAAQQLLDEVCSAGRAIRETGFRRQTSYGWARPNSNSIDTLPASRESRALQGSSNKDDARFGAAAPNDDCKESSSSMSFEERQDCEMKKAKLLHMLQEVAWLQTRCGL